MAEQLLPQVFRKDAPYIVSYNYQDIIQGQFYGVFYLSAAYDSAGAVDYFIAPATTRADPTDSSISSGDAADYAKVSDIDFDILVNKPFVIQGNFFAGFTTYCYVSSGSHYGYFVVRLRKWNGVTETEIGSGQSSNHDNTLDGTTTYKQKAIIANISTKTSFKAGEYLRVTVETWAKHTGGSTGILGFLHDPANTTSFGTPALPSSFIINIPFIAPI